MLLTMKLHSATMCLVKGGKNMINANKIKIRMLEKNMTQKDLAVMMGMAQSTLSQKINNVRPMDLNEAENMSELLEIPQEEFALYFFYKKSCVVLHEANKGEIR